jgi:hypothetical protein
MTEIIPIITKAPIYLLIAFAVGLIITTLSAILMVKAAGATSGEAADTNRRLESLEKKLDQLISGKTGPVSDQAVQVSTQVTVKIDFPIPLPEPAKKVDVSVALKDTFQDIKTSGNPIIPASTIFRPITDSKSLVHLVLANQIRVDTVTLRGRSSSSPKLSNTPHEVLLKLTNTSDARIETSVPKGQVFENKVAGTGFQNLVAAGDHLIHLNPGESKYFYLAGYCLNANLKSPSGQDGNMTPISVKFDFNSQNEVWSGVSAALHEFSKKK